MTAIRAASETAAAKHPNDYYYRPGMPLREAPARALPTDTWYEMRKRLFSRWIDVKPVPQMTDKLNLLADHLWQGDELCDSVVALGREIGPGRLREAFEKAVEHGTDAGDIPEEIVALLTDMERTPDWFDPEAYERGRLLMVDCSIVGKFGGQLVNVIMTAYGEAVGSATGATGRFQKDPYRRNLETTAFFQTIPLPDALERNSTTFKTTARVRLMHGQIRAALRKKWGEDVYAVHGDTISNTDMNLGVPAYATINLMLDEQFGRRITARDLDDVTMFWSYHAFRFGISERLLPRNSREAIEQFDWTLATYGSATNQWGPTLAKGFVDLFGESFTSSDSRVSNFVGRHVILPLVLGFIVDIGRDPVGYLTAGSAGAGRKQLQRYSAVFRVAAHVGVRLIGLGDRLPGRRQRMLKRAENGDSFVNGSLESLKTLSAKHGVNNVTFQGHDSTSSAGLANKPA